MSTTKSKYDPDMEACRMIVRTSEVTCYVMNSCCKNYSAEQREKVDKTLVHIYRQAILCRHKKEKDC